jgi:outer membrane protein assembly factor BamB
MDRTMFKRIGWMIALSAMMLSVQLAYGQLEDSPWPMFHHDPQHTGRSPYKGPDNPYLKWRFSTGAEIVSSPAIGADGTIYIGSDDFRLYAINQYGLIKWSFAMGGWVSSSPAIGVDGTIYVRSDDYKFYAINPDGSLKWSYPTGGPGLSSPTIGTDGTIYVGSRDGKLYALRDMGTYGDIRWTYTTGGYVESSPAVDALGSPIYVGSYDHNLYAIKFSGERGWTYTTGDEVWTSPAIGPDRTIYATSHDDGVLYALNPTDGSLKWSYFIGYWSESSPALGADGTIYVGSSDDCKLYAIADHGDHGELLWSYFTNSYVQCAPAVDSAGTIYIGAYNKLYAINPDGSLKWSYPTGWLAWSSPVLGADGTVYIGSLDHDLYAIGHRRRYLIWDNDAGRTFIYPTGCPGALYCGEVSPLITSPDEELRKALAIADPEAIIEVTDQDTSLVDIDLRDYDMVCAVLGWSESFGTGSAGVIEFAERESLMAYLDDGGALYLEGNDAFQYHDTTTFFKEYLGGELDVPAVKLDSVSGEIGTFLEGFEFAYYPDHPYWYGPHSSIDGIRANQFAEKVLKGTMEKWGREDKNVGIRAIDRDAISFSFVLGALKDDRKNTRAHLVREIIENLGVAGAPLIDLDLEPQECPPLAASMESGGYSFSPQQGDSVFYPSQPICFTYAIANTSDEPFDGYLHLRLEGEPRLLSYDYCNYFGAEHVVVASGETLISTVQMEDLPDTVVPSAGYDFYGHVSHSVEDTEGPGLDQDHFQVSIRSPVECELIPDSSRIVIPAWGGIFEFTLRVENVSPLPVSMKYWTDQKPLPDGEVSDTLIGPCFFELEPGAVHAERLVQKIPYTAPPGTFCYCLNGGKEYRKPDPFLWAQDCIEYRKQGN